MKTIMRRLRLGKAARVAAKRACIVVISLAAAGLTLPVADAAASTTSALTGPVHWSFEDGTLQGWHVVSGSFGKLIDNHVNFTNRGTPYNDEGNWHLSTMNTPSDGWTDGYTGVIQSPEFQLSRPAISMLVGGGNDANEYVAVCVADPSAADGCHQVAKTQGPEDEIMQYRTLNLAAYIGQTVFIEIVDQSTGGWGHVTLDDVRANAPAMPSGLTTGRSSNNGVTVSWKAVNEPGVTGYDVYRSEYQDHGFVKLTSSPLQGTTYRDNSAGPDGSYFYQVSAVGTDGSESERNITYAREAEDLSAKGSTVTYSGSHLSGIELPVGPLGAGGILHFGDGTRNESWIFNHDDTFRSRQQGSVPNSFFAVRAASGTSAPVVRALQTAPAGSFPAMHSLSFQGEYPLAHYQYQDSALPVQVSENVFNPTIPGDLKNSAIPTAIYNFTLKNPTQNNVSVSLLASQQNAVGFNGVGTISGANNDSFSGYGDNQNAVTVGNSNGSLSMTGKNGSMALSVGAGKVSGTADWTNADDLQGAFGASGTVSGPSSAASPSAGTTVDGALASTVSIGPGGQVTIPVVLSWNFPTNPTRGFGGEGEQYTNWWPDAASVDQYVRANMASLAKQTQLFHHTMYDSNLPQYVLDRLTSGMAVLHTPSVFWAKNGFFGGWEGYGCCWGMPNHVWEYAQTASALWPQVGKMWVSQWLNAEQSNGLLPYRYDAPGQNYGVAFDGQAGVILSAYRTYLQDNDATWLKQYWPRIKAAMEYLITSNDSNRDGVLTGALYNTYDSSESGTGSWMGSLYLAAVNATAHMAKQVGDTTDQSSYQDLYGTGQASQEKMLWNGSYYVEDSQNLPGTRAINDGVDIDMLLGQWWSTQLGLGDIYNSAHMNTAEQTLFSDNFHENFLGGNPFYRIFGRIYPEFTDAGMMNVTWPNNDQPANALPYYDETWTGTEYEAAATMIQRGLVDDGLRIVRAVSDRYDGQLRNAPYITSGGCASGDGSGNPFGDVECGQWYSRSMSGWSLLTALQGATYDGPAQAISFAPEWQPANHKSFFTAGTAWGTFTQHRDNAGSQRDDIAISNGSLVLQHVSLVTAGAASNGVTVTVGGKNVSGVTVSVSGPDVSISLPSAVTVTPGAPLKVTLG